MSEHEHEVLERLEQQFRPTFPVTAVSRWTHPSRERRLSHAAIMLPVGVLLLCLAVALAGAGGIALAVLGYLLVVGGSALLVGCRTTSRTEPRLRRAARPLRFFQ